MHIRSAWSAKQGPRAYMEDRCVVSDTPTIKIWAVFDGHGGYQVAEILKERVPLLVRTLLNKIQRNPLEIEKWLTLLFTRLDLSLFKEQLYQTVGSTVCIAILINNELYLVNIGDSRAILFDQKGKILARTIDHKPQNPLESVRIAKSYNGSVIRTPDQMLRVGGVLAVSRAMGDFSDGLKTYNGQYLEEISPVSPVPDIFYYQIRGPCYLVLGTDGLWDALSNTDVAKKVCKCQNLKGACTDLIKMALSRSTDNVTVVISEIKK